MIDKSAKIYIAGHRGLVGSAILQNLKDKGYTNFILKTHTELDLTDQKAVSIFFEQEQPEYVILAAAKVGGIVANNTYRADFIYENLMIQNNVIHQSFLNGVKKLIFLGSTCIYPKLAEQPIKENELLEGALEYTNEPYAIAKIAGIKMCESYNIQYHTNFLAIMPTNLYGKNDNFNLETSHVLPALLRKIHLGKCLEKNDWDSIKLDLEARPIEGISGKSEKSEIISILGKYGISKNGSTVTITLWGSGVALREFLWSEDMADATVHILERVNYSDMLGVIQSSGVEIRNTHINIGTGKEISIKDLANLIKEKIEFKGIICFDKTKPDGTLRKLTDVSKLSKLGWKYSVEINNGIENMYNWYRQYNI